MGANQARIAPSRQSISLLQISALTRRRRSAICRTGCAKHVGGIHAPAQCRCAGDTAVTDRTLLGTGISFIAFLVLSLADALTKLLADRGYSVFQIASIDAVFALLVALPFLIRQ